ncbi:glycosyltransferase [Cognatilysobacter lacus]|uniref:Glycosyltransferase family 4 protein n=1 Tax=Cognatilysobacter lacus TaxID=1643323 RepID=A0A5D8YTJ9_9GAMM|nr:glycosyltransferase [Lysobacter lacus]TZF85232.1 glycosyltransferase family 4 protein [Lysobacter lacus]
MLLPFLARNGWQAEVLTVAPQHVAAPLDPWLEGGLPGDVPIHRVDAPALRWSRLPGLGTHGIRSLPALAAAGNRLLAERHFDLVYFSTTMFEVHVLGPRWKARHGVPFVMDYQDLWVSDYYREHPDVVPPGGRLKYGVASTLHRFMEPRVLRGCAGITSVSPAYPQHLIARYPGLVGIPTLVQGFPGAASDFERVPDTDATTLFGGEPGLRRWVYAGRGGADMGHALRALFGALRDHADEGFRSGLRLHFIGTSYAAHGTGARTIEPIAAEFGLSHLVHESPDRIHYSRTLACLRAADALIVPGSDDPAYTASKIYPYLLAGRPLLAIFHERSTVTDLMRRAGGGVCVSFSTAEPDADIAERIARDWLATRAYENPVALDAAAFAPHTDVRCAAELCAFFDACVDSEARP